MGKSATAYSSYGKHINLQYMSQSEYLSLTGSAHRGAMYLTSSGPGSNITSSYIMQLGPTGSDGLTVSAYKFKGDGSLLTGVVADIDGATDGTGITVHATQDKLLISDNGTEKYIQVSQLDNVFLRSDQADTINGTLTATGRVMVDDTTEATSKTDGSLQTDGGLSVAKSAVIGIDLDLVKNGAIINFGSSSPFVMTHNQANNAALVSSGHRLAFGDAGDYITGDGTDISIVGSNEINLDATTVDINAAVSISGNTSGSTAQFAKLTASAGYFAELFVSGSTLHLGGTSISAAEIAPLDGIDAGTVAASKAVIVNSDKDVTGFRNITLTGELDAGSLDISGNADIDGTLETDALSINSTLVTATAAELNILDGVTATAAELNILDGVTSTAAELNILDGVTSTAAELNLLDGSTANSVVNSKAVVYGSAGEIAASSLAVAGNISGSGKGYFEKDVEIADSLKVSGSGTFVGTLSSSIGDFADIKLGGTAISATAAELNILDGVTATAAELNIMDGNTSATSTTLALADRVVVNDDGTMKQVALSDFVTLMEGADGIDAVNGNLTVGGNLTVNGSTVTVDATNMTVQDPLIKLNKGDTSSPARDQGFIFSRGNGSSADQANYAMLWDESADEFVFAAVGTEDATTSGNVTLSSYADLQAATIRGSKLEIDGANDYIDVDTDLKIIAAADVVIDPAGGELKVDGNVVPNSDSADSLGASGTAWANLYVDAIDLNGQGSISMGGTGRLDLDADDDTSIRASADDVITLEVGGADRVHFGAAAIYPETPDEISLGTASKNFSDLFLDSGAVVNFDDGDVTMTHSSNNLSVAGGHFQVERLRIDGSTNYLDVVSSDLRAYAAQNIHLDAASHIKLDAGGNNILFENDGTRFGAVQNSSGDLQLSASTGDLVLIGSDNSSAGNDIYLDSSDKIILDADGGSILYKDGGTTKAKLDLADSGYSMHFSASAAGDIAWSSKVSGKIMELDDSAAALMLNSTNKIQFAGTGNYVHQRASNVLEVKAPTVEIDGATAIDLQTDALSIGEGGDTDVVVTFNANTNDGVLTWMEDEDYFKFSDDVLMNSDEKIQFAGTGNYVHQRASNVLEVKAPTVEIDGATKIDLQSDAITLGTGGNTDVALTFAGSTSSGALTWMEDEDEFKFDDDVMIADDKKLLFGNDSDATLGFDPTAGTDGLVLTSAKNVYLTTPSGVEPADFTPTFVISSFHNDDGKQSANNTGGGLVFAKSRSGNLMSDGDHIGGIRFRDGSGTHTNNYAQIYGIATSANGNDGSVAIECRVNSANVEIAQFGYKSGSTRYGLYLNNNADHGTIKAHSFITYSDETLKDNITPIDSGLDKVMALQGVSYDWKSDGTADIGFIAQEVEKVVPQAVYGKSDGEYGLDYGSLTSVLVEAVKEQQAQIEDLKAELKNKADK